LIVVGHHVVGVARNSKGDRFSFWIFGIFLNRSLLFRLEWRLELSLLLQLGLSGWKKRLFANQDLLWVILQVIVVLTRTLVALIKVVIQQVVLLSVVDGRVIIKKEIRLLHQHFWRHRVQHPLRSRVRGGIHRWRRQLQSLGWLLYFDVEALCGSELGLVGNGVLLLAPLGQSTETRKLADWRRETRLSQLLLVNWQLQLSLHGAIILLA
jgi:hypothetical protein